MAVDEVKILAELEARLGDRAIARRVREGHEARATTAFFSLQGTGLTLIFRFHKRRVIVG
jgi:hypothetical protein